MSLSVKAVSSVADDDYVVGFVSEEGGRGRIFLAKGTGSPTYNYPKADGAPVAVVAPAPETVIDGGPTNYNGPYYLNLTFDPASPDSGSNGRFLVSDGTQVIIASTGTG